MSSDADLIDALLPSAHRSHVNRRSPQDLECIAKSLFDVVVALVAILVLSPVLLLLGGLVIASTGHGAIYRHRRVGRNGRPFCCYKFQTMLPRSDEVLARHLANDPAAAREWALNRKLRNDPRVTWIGRFLRLTSLDELPQLFNVLLGDMSFVGPRPITFDELERYGEQAYRFMLARPGLTGLWQISGRSSLSYSERVALDMQYLQTRSNGSDFIILLKTLPALARTRQSA